MSPTVGRSYASACLLDAAGETEGRASSTSLRSVARFLARFLQWRRRREGEGARVVVVVAAVVRSLVC